MSDDKLQESSTGRRDFLKFLGFSVAAATVAACEAPVTKAIPCVNKPENVTPGMPTWYASTYYDGNSYASILVKTREGRPIFVKGNKDFGISDGVTNPQIIASVLGLYDSSRLTAPQTVKDGVLSAGSPSDIDRKVKKALKSSKDVVIVSNTIISPSMNSALRDLSISLGGLNEDLSIANDKIRRVTYDAVSYAGIRASHKQMFGLTQVGNDALGILPNYDFSKAKTIVSIGADFLNSWLLPTQFSAQYGKTRNPDNDWMSRHFQFESMMSVTGSNADYRGMIKPSEQANVIAALLKGLGGSTSGVSTTLRKDVQKVVDEAVKSLKKSKGESLVVCGSNDKDVQLLVNKLNFKIGAYKHTVNINNPINLFQSNDEDMNKLVDDVIKGKCPETIVFYGTNPVYTHPRGKEFGKALSKVKHKISLSMHADETAGLCDVIVPDHHGLEGWNDYKPTKEHYSLAQPTIRPLGGTSSAMESVLVWAGKAKRAGKDSKVAYDYIKENWIKYGFSEQTEYADTETYWNMMVHNSCGKQEYTSASEPLMINDAVKTSKLPKGGGLEVVLYQKSAIGIGNMSSNPWLQEMPDTLTKVTWDNCITMAPVDMEKGDYVQLFDQENGLDLATVKVGKEEVTLPVFPLPGQMPGTIGIALGYGRGSTPERIGAGAFVMKEYGGVELDENDNPKSIGENVFVFMNESNGTLSLNVSNASIEKKNEKYLIAATQIHHTVMARQSIVRETTLDIYKGRDRTAYNPEYKLSKLDKDGNHVQADIDEFDLWEAHPVEKIGHRWGMTIDLNQCFGCGSCLIACQAENNVPVVGKDEVRRGREMHWLRIDRYFSSDVEATVGTRNDKFNYDDAEDASLNPKVVHMPMMCQHCNHAPCETVCPVAATTHSNEGLNQMTYNRCIGTRYCANNCPYKVRRFNWFNYPSYKKFTEVNPAQDDLGRMVLNPDVTVRTRGVMEKCSMCVQNIQAAKLVAKMDGRPVSDEDVSSVCGDACPSGAIIFGDWNDLTSKVRESSEDNRSYQVLEEVGTKPNIWYKTKIRNEQNEELAAIQTEEHHESEEGHGDEHGSEHAEGHGNNH